MTPQQLKLIELAKKRYPGLAKHSENQMAMEQNMAPPPDPMLPQGPTQEDIMIPAAKLPPQPGDRRGGTGLRMGGSDDPTQGAFSVTAAEAAGDRSVLPKRAQDFLAARDAKIALTAGHNPEAKEIARRDAAEKDVGLPPRRTDVAPPSASNAGAPEPVLPPGVDVPADDPKGQFLRAHALRGAASGGDMDRRDRLQLLQDFDSNMQIAPNLIDVASWGNPSQMIQYGGSGPPNESRQKEIDEINKSEATSQKNAADIEAARVKNESAANALRPMTAEQVKAQSDIDSSIADIEGILRDLPKHAGSVGQLDSRVGGAMEVVGGDAEGAAFRGRVQDSFNKYTQARSGAGVPLAEIPRMEKAYFSIRDTENILKQKAEAALKTLKEDKARVLGNLGKGDFDTSEFPQGGGEKRAALDPSGKPGKLPANSDLSKYPGWKWA